MLEVLANHNTIYISSVCTLNLHNFIYQLHIIKPEKIKEVEICEIEDSLI